jgi:hypothetical protein
MSTSDTHGPIDVLVLQFPMDADGQEVRTALLDLVDRDLIRIYDLMVVRKDADGNTTEVASGDGGPGGDAGLDAFRGARSGLIGDEDLEDIKRLLDPDTVGGVLVYENSWAIPFVEAARAAGGELVATTRLTAQEIADALDAVEGED